MRRWHWVVLFFIGAGLVAWGLWRPEPAPVVVAPPAENPFAGLIVGPSVVSAPRTQGALSGLVIRRGAPAAGIRVIARDEVGPTEALSDSTGRFVLTPLPAGQYWLAATSEKEASPLQGPILLQAGGHREGILLELQPAARVSGTVMDSVTRQTLAGALVRSSGGSTVTDHAGRFTLVGLAVGQTWIEAVEGKHLPRLDWLSVDAARDVEGMEIFLRPAGTLKGLVTRMNRPVPGATVWAEVAALNERPRTFGPSRSAADGSFSLSVEGGAVRLVASSPEGARVEGPPMSLGEGETREGVVLELGEGLSAHGRVLMGGQPVDGAQVVLIDSKSQRAGETVATHDGGRFDFSGLATGNYLLQVFRGSLITQRGPYPLEMDGASWDVDIAGGGQLRGLVQPEQGGVSVRWRSGLWAGPMDAETRTDDSGHFVFDGVSEGPLWVEAVGEAGSARVQTTAGADVTLHLVPTVLRGKVVTEGGQPATDFTVRLTPADSGGTRSFPVLNASGEFSLKVPPGSYDVTAVASGFGETAQSQHADLKVDVPAPYLTLLLQASAALEGVVLDGRTRGPLGGVELTFLKPAMGAGRWATLVTRSDGEFRLSAAPRSGWVQVRKEGYGTAWVQVEGLLRQAAGGRAELILNPGRSTNMNGVEPYEGVGLQLDFNGGVKAAGVFQGSPAEAAGIRAGDVVVAIDGESVTGIAPSEIVSKIMGPSGTTVRLSLQRGSETLDVSVRRRTIQL